MSLLFLFFVIHSTVQTLVAFRSVVKSGIHDSFSKRRSNALQVFTEDSVPSVVLVTVVIITCLYSSTKTDDTLKELSKKVDKNSKDTTKKS